MKFRFALLALACVPTAFAANNAPLPKDNVTDFVAEKLDITTLPASIRPRPQKTRKTFADYGYVLQQRGDQQSLLEAAPGSPQINIRILEQNASAIYVCVRTSSEAASSKPIQRVLFLKLKNADSLLKGRESFKEFSGCPVLGGDDSDSSSSGYGG